MRFGLIGFRKVKKSNYGLFHDVFDINRSVKFYI